MGSSSVCGSGTVLTRSGIAKSCWDVMVAILAYCLPLIGREQRSYNLALLVFHDLPLNSLNFFSRADNTRVLVLGESRSVTLNWSVSTAHEQRYHT